jgi:putative endonuclease
MRWYVYLIPCRSNAIYTGITLDVAPGYPQHLPGGEARYTRANPPRRLLTQFVCPTQSVAGTLVEVAARLGQFARRKLTEQYQPPIRML